MNLDRDSYLTRRLDDQIEWYGAKAAWNQTWYKRLRAIEIVAAATIPFLTGYFSTGGAPIQFTVGALGLLVAVLSGLISLYRFQENWVEYRKTCETLKQQKYLFETGAPPYDGEDGFQRLVGTVESIIAGENAGWASRAAAAAAPVSAAASAPAPDAQG